MLLRAIIADSRLYLRVRPNAPQITVKYSATSGTEANPLALTGWTVEFFDAQSGVQPQFGIDM